VSLKRKRLALFVVVLTSASVSRGETEEIYVPKTVEEAIQNLHRTQADGHAWAGFGLGTYASFAVRASMGSSKEEKFPMKDVLEGRTERGVEVAAIAELDGGNLKRDWRQGVHDRPELAPSNAVMLSEEEVTIGTTSYQTSVYEFTSTAPAPEGAVWSFKYWLAGGVPDGIVKVHYCRV